MLFADRSDAGRRLADRLRHLKGEDVVVVGLPRGGVPVAFPVAQTLDVPLDVIVVRKLGVPFQPELGMGAVGEGRSRVINSEVVAAAGVSEQDLARVEAAERKEVERQARLFRGDRPRAALLGRTVVVVDDGIATGATARSACELARDEGADRVVLAVPVAPDGWDADLHDVADELVALETPVSFGGVGRWYRDFAQTTDDEVVVLLERAGQEAGDRPEPRQ